MQHGFIELPLTAWSLDPTRSLDVTDLLSGERYHWRGSRNYVRLDPEARVAHILLVQLDEALAPEPALEV
jgi:starch synthase (maltosyl-transferring)